MRILVVDDEIVSRKKMQIIMEGFGESEAVGSGVAALGAFEKAWENLAPFDLISLDISMPDMDGTEVLCKIRKIEKGKKVSKEQLVKVMMVTSHSDKDTVITCMQAGCDDYIAKPFDRETILKKFEKLGLTGQGGVQPPPRAPASGATKKSVLQEISTSFRQGTIDLPSLPNIGFKFKEIIKKGADLQQIIDLLKQDAAICSKLIGVSNSPFYRGITKNKTLEQAINRLGLDVTSQFVYAICNRALYTDIAKKYKTIVEKLWDHSISCAHASQIISEVLGLNFQEEVFTMGLLHDIGKLLLLQVLGEFGKKEEFAEEVDSVELLDTLDKFHEEFGAALLKRWKFSREYVQIALCHHDIEEAYPIPKELLVVHFANLLVNSMGYHLEQQGENDLEKADSALLLGLNSDKIADVRGKVEERLEGLEKILI